MLIQRQPTTKTPLYDFAVAECDRERSRRAILGCDTLHRSLPAMDKYRPDFKVDKFLRRKTSTFAVQHVKDGHVRFRTSSMRRRPELSTVNVDIGFISEQRFDDLEAAPDDSDAQRHFPLRVDSIDVCASIEKAFDRFHRTAEDCMVEGSAVRLASELDVCAFAEKVGESSFALAFLTCSYQVSVDG